MRAFLTSKSKINGTPFKNNAKTLKPEDFSLNKSETTANTSPRTAKPKQIKYANTRPNTGPNKKTTGTATKIPINGALTEAVLHPDLFWGDDIMI